MVPEGRKSIKYKATWEGCGLRTDVFAADEEKAVIAARVFYEIPDGVEITVERASENGHGHHGSGRKEMAGAAAGVAPGFHPQMETRP